MEVYTQTTVIVMNDAAFNTKQSAGHVLQLVDNIPTPVWSADAHGAIDFLNQRWIDYTGLRLQEFQGRLWIDAGFIHPEDITGLIDQWHAILASGQIGEAEARMKRFDGEYRWFLFRIVPLHDKSGRVVKWYGTNIEMEDRKWTEALLAGEKRLLEMIAGYIRRGAGRNLQAGRTYGQRISL